jgi:ketosteroid isomerase-like protein
MAEREVVSHGAAVRETDEQALRELDIAGANAAFTRNAEALGQVYDAEFVLHYGESRRVRTRAEVLADVANAPWGYRTFIRQPDYVSVHGDIGVTMGAEQVVPDRTHPSGAPADQPLDRRYTHVYRRRAGRWTLLVRHANHLSHT